MGLYRADNAALSTTTIVGPGTSYATNAAARVAIQLNVPDSMTIYITEIGWSQDVATATGTLLELATTDTGSTVSTAHTTTTVKPLLNNQSNGSRLTYGATTNTGYGNATITSNTTLRTLHKLYVPQTYVYTYPLGTYPVVGNGTAESFVQLRVMTTATVNGYCWIVFDEE